MPANIVPGPIQKQLRKEVYNGCAICGCPVLEYIHIINHTEVDTFLPENMIAVCPTHHMTRDNKDLSEASLRNAKNSPYNKTHEDESFVLKSQEMTVNIGRRKFINTSRILVVDDFDIISVKREDDKYVLLDINFFDKLNNLIAIVSENCWTAEKSNDWTINYKPKHLQIQNKSKSISFEVKIENNNNNVVTLLAEGMYYNGYTLKITENEIFLGDEEIATDLKGTELRNYEVGIDAVTS